MGMGLAQSSMLGFDLETTGTNRFRDLPVSLAFVSFDSGHFKKERAELVNPGIPIPPGATEIHGITDEAVSNGLPLAEAAQVIWEELRQAEEDQVMLIGMNLAYDLTIVDCILRSETDKGLLERQWHGVAIDVLVLDRHFDPYRSGKRNLSSMATHYGVESKGSHDASIDAQMSVSVFMALCDKFPVLNASNPLELREAQSKWHRSWAEGYNSYRQKKGMTHLPETDYFWPIAPSRT